MILLDPRRGSGELLPYFKPFGDVEVAVGPEMEYGDACFVGNGPEGQVMVGVERKVIRDLCQSMRDRRLAGHQLPGLCKTYGFVYLIIEGIWRPGNRGELEIRRGKSWVSAGVHYREVDAFLTSLELFPPTEFRTGVIVRRTGSAQETATAIVNLYKWFNDKKWDKHTSHNQVYAPAPVLMNKGRKAGFHFRDPKLLEKIAAQLPGIDTRCQDVYRSLPPALRRLQASKPEDWIVKGAIGKKIAERIVEDLKK